ncbi:MAG: hypothetical protein LBP73_02670 [Clostridiales Family XIII bacterium]|nr:hypothetical protein [Clostridiales Family XIII bacterium]
MASIFVTPEVSAKEDAINGKISRLQGKLFGIPMIKFSVASMKKVLVPYRCFVFDFKLSGRNAKWLRLNKKGCVGIIFDLNEVHSFEYDYADMGDLALEKIETSENDIHMIKPHCSEEEAKEFAILYVQNRILKRIYRSTGELVPVKDVHFYRPAWQLEIRYKGKQITNMRYAYLDAYGIENEHILGLKVRLDESL